MQHWSIRRSHLMSNQAAHLLQLHGEIATHALSLRPRIPRVRQLSPPASSQKYAQGRGKKKIRKQRGRLGIQLWPLNSPISDQFKPILDQPINIDPEICRPVFQLQSFMNKCSCHTTPHNCSNQRVPCLGIKNAKLSQGRFITK